MQLTLVYTTVLIVYLYKLPATRCNILDETTQINDKRVEQKLFDHSHTSRLQNIDNISKITYNFPVSQIVSKMEMAKIKAVLNTIAIVICGVSKFPQIRTNLKAKSTAGLSISGLFIDMIRYYTRLIFNITKPCKIITYY